MNDSALRPALRTSRSARLPGLVAALVFLLPAALAHAQAARPNIVLILTGDQGFTTSLVHPAGRPLPELMRRRDFLRCSGAALLGFDLWRRTAARPPLEQVDLFTAGEGGYHTYRIPALITTTAGALLAFCEGRRAGRGDIDLLLRRSSDGGRTWTASRVVWDDGPNTCGNPCPVVDERTGTV